MTDADRQYNGQMLESLCRMSDQVLKAYGIPPERAKVCTCADCYQPLGTGPCIACDSCGGSGLVPANSGSDVADFKCQECNGKGVRP